ncbi:MAG: hypothetical protein WD646_06205 [Actinomycetota bacterium]
MRRVTSALVLVLALAMPMASAPAQTDRVPQIEEVPGPIVQLLEDYGRSFVDHDVGLLTQTVSSERRETEAKALQNASDVDFERFTVRATTQYSGNLASKRVQNLYPDMEVATYHVILESTIGPESGVFEEDGIFTFTKDPERGGGYDGWRLASDSDLEPLGFFSPVHLWDGGPMSVLTSEHFILLTHPGTADEMRPVLEVAERAYAKVAEFWPRPIAGNFVIIAPSTSEELGRILHETAGVSRFVAFVVGGANRERGWEPTDPRVFIHVDHLRNYGTDAQVEILAHELIHAVTRPLSGPKIPNFVEEGLANAGGGTGGRRMVTGGPAPDDFPTDEGFVTGPVGEIQGVYDRSQLAIQALIDSFGVEGVARFYETLGKERVVAGTDEYHVRRTIEATTDWSYEEWLAAWRKRVG